MAVLVEAVAAQMHIVAKLAQTLHLIVNLLRDAAVGFKTVEYEEKYLQSRNVYNVITDCPFVGRIPVR